MTRRLSLCVLAALALHGFATPSADCAGPPGEAEDSPPKRILHAWDGVTMWATTAAPLIDGKWHHLAVTVDQDSAGGKVTRRLFIDGEPGN